MKPRTSVGMGGLEWQCSANCEFSVVKAVSL